MFVACGIWCLADVSTVSPSSEQTKIVDELRSTESAIINSYSTSVSGIIVSLNTKHWIKIYRTIFSTDSSFRPFCGKIFMIKMLVSIFGQTTVYKIYTVSRELTRLLEIQYPVFGI